MPIVLINPINKIVIYKIDTLIHRLFRYYCYLRSMDSITIKISVHWTLFNKCWFLTKSGNLCDILLRLFSLFLLVP